jgi:hypothetical protein
VFSSDIFIITPRPQVGLLEKWRKKAGAERLRFFDTAQGPPGNIRTTVFGKNIQTYCFYMII